ncbi:hypothetical protein RvY_08398 [Ramazzottius varieornatus]|uniref:Uncharacterized protein n=1 Tax=Ramazzottius varieornatus TaxID=947166 RepID=A0A1D1V8C4_RAMVA|nr:hypothetical protein RvY_08398 [Ramazzottius varieornatus]
MYPNVVTVPRGMVHIKESSAEPYLVSNIKYLPKQCYQCVTVVNEQNQVVTKKEPAETKYCIAANRTLLSQNVTTCRRNETCTVYITRIGTGTNNGTTPPARGYQFESEYCFKCTAQFQDPSGYLLEPATNFTHPACALNTLEDVKELQTNLLYREVCEYDQQRCGAELIKWGDGATRKSITDIGKNRYAEKGNYFELDSKSLKASPHFENACSKKIEGPNKKGEEIQNCVCDFHFCNEWSLESMRFHFYDPAYNLGPAAQPKATVSSTPLPPTTPIPTTNATSETTTTTSGTTATTSETSATTSVTTTSVHTSSESRSRANPTSPVPDDDVIHEIRTTTRARRQTSEKAFQLNVDGDSISTPKPEEKSGNGLLTGLAVGGAIGAIAAAGGGYYIWKKKKRQQVA